MRIRKAVFTLICTLGCISAVYAQPRVASVDPRQNEINVAATARVRVTFQNPIDSGTLNDRSLLVHGSQTGRYSGTVSYDPGLRTATFLPRRPFRPGETVSVVATDGIENGAEEPLLEFQWQFTVAVDYGTGSFDTSIEVALGGSADNPTGIFAGDFDGDQFLDLAVVSSNSNTLSILTSRLMNLGGSFTITDEISVGSGRMDVTGADLDIDGALDLVVVNAGSNTLSYVRNNGSGRFSIQQTLTTANNPTQVNAGDYNNDGLKDLAVVSLADQLQIFFNQGNGVFPASPQNYTVGSNPYGIASGDYNNDGDVDIVVTNSGDNTIRVYNNDGTGQFVNSGEITVPAFPTIVRTNDLFGRTATEYGDGFLDLVLVHPNSNTISIMDNRSRDGGFTAPAAPYSVGVRPQDVFIADFDTTDALAQSAGFSLDHDLDLAVPSYLSEQIDVLENQFNNGYAQDPADVFLAGANPGAITGGDFDRDGDIDLAVTNGTRNGVTILLNRGGAAEIILSPNGLDFGEVYVGSDSTMTITMFNPTQENVFLDVPPIHPVFSFNSAPILPPGTTLNYDITFSPADTLVYIDSLTIRASNPRFQQQFRVGVTGRGIRGILSVAPDTLIFGNVQPPQRSTLPIQVTNSGNGALIISNLSIGNPAFSVPVGNLTLPPYSTQPLNVTFAPPAPGIYADSLILVSNDIVTPRRAVTLLGGPNQYRPHITSPVSVTATERQPFQYTAAAIDSDAVAPTFIFRNLPAWLIVDATNPARVVGTPPEGALDTTFTLIATDGWFSDTQIVSVQVTPVNDPPIISQLTDQTVAELSQLTLDFTASDPEDSTLIFSIQGLPSNATFTNNGNQTATFRWVPLFGSRGVYTVTVIVSEVNTQPSLSDTAVVRITVLPALPDIIMSSIDVNNTDVTLNQTRRVTVTIRNENAPVTTPFRLTITHNGTARLDTVINRMQIDEERNFSVNIVFNSLGSHRIVAEADVDQQVVEGNEDNNRLALQMNVSRGQLIVRPNPFTPNNDGYNDAAVFDFGDLVLVQPELTIFDFNGVLLSSVTTPNGDTFEWDGRDQTGREQTPGVYLYVLTDESQRVTSGYVVLAR
jgi:gliding motility-associated-like protein